MVVVVKPREPLPSLVIQARDTVAQAAPVVVMAALQPPPSTPRKSIAVKLLVDCSGSMGGDSIASARAALHGALACLTEHDHVSISRFGSTVEHALTLTACTPKTLRRLNAAIDAIDADLGGTEMEAALKAVFGLRVPRDCAGADVLMVTDGEIWQAEEMIAAARSSGHRVFAIGVGSSPAEDVLRSLAEATGGACEFATPGEALEAAAGRMLVRIRQQPWRDARVDWGCETLWQTALPASVFGGDTVIAFAGVPALAAASTVRLLAVGAQGAATEVARGEADAPCPGDTLPRMAAARRIATADEGQALELAVAYQLMSRHTNCILVHERAAADKVTEEAELHRVSSMLAAGWGATASLMMSPPMSLGSLAGLSTLCAGSAPADMDVCSLASEDPFEALSFASAPLEEQPRASLDAIVEAAFEHLSHGGSVRGLAARCEALALNADVRLALYQAAVLGLCYGEALLLLGLWANIQRPGPSDSTVTAALLPHLDPIDAAVMTECLQLFDRVLGPTARESWTLSRARRLRRALGRPSP